MLVYSQHRLGPCWGWVERGLPGSLLFLFLLLLVVRVGVANFAQKEQKFFGELFSQSILKSSPIIELAIFAMIFPDPRSITEIDTTDTLLQLGRCRLTAVGSADKHTPNSIHNTIKFAFGNNCHLFLSPSLTCIALKWNAILSFCICKFVNLKKKQFWSK